MTSDDLALGNCNDTLGRRWSRGSPAPSLEEASCHRQLCEPRDCHESHRAGWHHDTNRHISSPSHVEREEYRPKRERDDAKRQEPAPTFAPVQSSSGKKCDATLQAEYQQHDAVALGSTQRKSEREGCHHGCKHDFAECCKTGDAQCHGEDQCGSLTATSDRLNMRLTRSNALASR